MSRAVADYLSFSTLKILTDTRFYEWVSLVPFCTVGSVVTSFPQRASSVDELSLSTIAKHPNIHVGRLLMSFALVSSTNPFESGPCPLQDVLAACKCQDLDYIPCGRADCPTYN